MIRLWGSGLTCDADFGRPLGGPIQHSLLGCLQMAVDVFFRDVEHLLDHLEHLWTVLLPDFHALLHRHDDILGLVLCPMLGALLHCPWNKPRVFRPNSLQPIYLVSIEWDFFFLSYLSALSNSSNVYHYNCLVWGFRVSEIWQIHIYLHVCL